MVRQAMLFHQEGSNLQIKKKMRRFDRNSNIGIYGAPQLKPIYDWVKIYERYWTHQIGRTIAV